MNTPSLLTIHTGDVLTGLAKIDAGSVQTCITSPPYFGLRDYGTATWDGGDPACPHAAPSGGPSAKQESSQGTRSLQCRHVCRSCGAVRVDEQIGLEDTPDAYVARLVAVFREVRRVLREDGTLWLNLGDSYASAWPCSRRNQIGNASLADGTRANRASRVSEGLKEKDLIGIPWRVAFALQADGWYLRQDIIWAKPNPMPESVRDRCTKGHEYLFLLSKSPRYHFDAAAIKEPAVYAHQKATGGKKYSNRAFDVILGGAQNLDKMTRFAATRNKRSVWTVTPKPFRGAHFATMPPGLVEPCVLAGARAGDLVLDPFTGSGTTAVVALQHGRRFVGTELNPAFVAMAHARVAAETNAPALRAA